jgi:hypothetical protein
MTRSSCLLRCACVLALIALGGCGDPAGNQTAPGPQLPAPLGPAAFSTELEPYQPGVQWGADGRTIYAVSRLSPTLPHGIVAIEVPTGHTRMVVTANNASIQVLRISGDGAFLFYSSERIRTQADPHNEGFSIFRVPTSGVGGEELVRGASHPFAISPDGRMIAWKSHTSDSTFIRDLVTGETRFVTVGGYPLSISPDYATLLHSVTPGVGLTATVIATGQATATQGRLEDARWGATGEELLFWGMEGRVMVQRGVASARQVLWEPGPAHRFYNVHSATWSPDGSRVAASLAPGCIRAPCPALVVLIDVATGTPRVLVDSPAPLIGRAAFSADGRQIAVTSDGHLHVINLP